MTKEIPYRTVYKALQCLGHDPDIWKEAFADRSFIATIMHNRGALQEAKEASEQKLGQVAQKIGAVTPTEDGMEINQQDPRLREAEREIMDETVTVTLRTVSFPDAQAIAETVREEVGADAVGASAADWHWMYEPG
jgi:hypothetical protein